MKSINNDRTPEADDVHFESMVGIDTIKDRLQVPKKTLYKWVHEHRTNGFPFYKIGRHLRFRLTEVETWLRKFRRSGSGDRQKGPSEKVPKYS